MTELNICTILIFSPSGKHILLQESLDTEGMTKLAPPDILVPRGTDKQTQMKKLIRETISLENLAVLGNKRPTDTPPVECGNITYRYLDENGVLRLCTVTVFAHVASPIGITQPKNQMPLHWVPTWDYANAAPDSIVYDVAHGINTFVKTAADLITPLRAASPIAWRPLGIKPYEDLASDYYMVRTGKRYCLPKRAVTAMKNNRISLGTAYAMTDEMWDQIPRVGKTTKNQIHRFLEETMDILHFPLDIGTGDTATKGGGTDEPAKTE